MMNDDIVPEAPGPKAASKPPPTWRELLKSIWGMWAWGPERLAALPSMSHHQDMRVLKRIQRSFRIFSAVTSTVIVVLTVAVVYTDRPVGLVIAAAVGITLALMPFIVTTGVWLLLRLVHRLEAREGEHGDG